MADLRTLRERIQRLNEFLEKWTRLKEIVDTANWRGESRGGHEEEWRQLLTDLGRAYPRIEPLLRGTTLTQTFPAQGIQRTIEPISHVLSAVPTVHYVIGGLGASLQDFEAAWGAGSAALNVALGETQAAIDSVEEEIQTFPHRRFVDDAVAGRFPEVASTMEHAESILLEAEATEALHNVANTCREALMAFADRVYRPEYLPEGQSVQPKGQDFQNKLKYAVRANGAGDQLENLISAFVRYLHEHRYSASTTRQDSARCVAYTWFLMQDVASLLGGDRRLDNAVATSEAC